MYCIRCVVLLACLTVISASASVSAQSAKGGAPPGYDETIEAALQEFEAGNFAESRAQFLKAHGIFPNARTLRALGKAEYELKNYREATSYLAQALESKVRPLTPEQRAETQRLLDAARGYLGRYFVVVRPSDAKVLLDGTAISLGPDGQVVLNVGDHTLEVEAEGYLSERRQLRVTGGGSEHLLIELKPSAAESAPVTSLPQPTLPESASAPPATPERDDREATPLRRKWWLWTGVIAVVAGGTAAAVYLSLREPEQRAPTGGSSGLDVSVPASVRFR